MKSIKRIIFQNAGIISFVTLASYPLGYIRDMLVMRWFGAGKETDAWMIASQIPEILTKLLLFGALGASFIPVFTEFLMQKKEDEAWEVACTVINFVVLVLGFITLLGIIGAPLLISIFSPGFSQAAKDLAIKLTRIVFPLILILGVTGFITGIYNAYLKFTIPAIVGLLNPIVLVIFIIFLSQRIGILSLAYGTIAGASISLLILLVLFFKRKIPYSFKINLRHPAIRKIIILMIPLISADLLSHGGAIIWRMFASFLEEGSITSLTLANRLVFIPVFIFSSAAAIVVFPFFSRQSAQGDFLELRETLLLGIKMMFLILLPAMIGFMVIGKPIVRLLFERGLFDAADTRNTTIVLFFSSFGLLAYGINPILYRACYALKKNWYLFKYELIGFFLTLPSLYIFLKIMGLGGIALAGALVRIALVLYLCRVLSKELGGLNLRSLSATFYKAVISSLLMGGVCYTVFTILSNILPSVTLANQIIQVVSSIAAGAAFYFGLLILFKVEEIRKFLQVLIWRKNRS